MLFIEKSAGLACGGCAALASISAVFKLYDNNRDLRPDPQIKEALKPVPTTSETWHKSPAFNLK